MMLRSLSRLRCTSNYSNNQTEPARHELPKRCTEVLTSSVERPRQAFYMVLVSLGSNGARNETLGRQSADEKLPSMKVNALWLPAGRSQDAFTKQEGKKEPVGEQGRGQATKPCDTRLINLYIPLRRTWPRSSLLLPRGKPFGCTLST
jgi:hypothetical protein